MHKVSFAKAIGEVGNIIKRTKIIPDIINVGGGFPSVYPDLNPEPLDNYVNEIKNSIKSHIYDGAALTKFIFWLKNSFQKKKN